MTKGVRFRAGIITFIFITSCFAVMISLTNNVSAAPDTHVWDGGGTDVYAGTKANWDTDIAPEAGDAVVFNDGSLPCTWNLSITLDSFSMLSGYTGIVTFKASTPWGTSGDTVLNSGTLTGVSTSTFTCAGDFTRTSTTITSSVLYLNMTGTGKTLSAGTGVIFGKLSIYGTITVPTLTTTYSFDVGAGGTLQIPSGMIVNYHSGKTFANNGVIGDPANKLGTLYIYFRTVDQTLNLGTTYLNTVILASASNADANRKVTLGAATTINGNLSIYSSHATYTTTLDTAGYSLNISSNLTITTRGALDGDSSNIGVGNKWVSYSGSFDAETSTVTMYGTRTSGNWAYLPLIWAAPDQSFFNLAITGIVKYYRNVSVSNSLTVSAGASFQNYFTDDMILIDAGGTVPFVNEGSVRANRVYVNHTDIDTTVTTGDLKSYLYIEANSDAGGSRTCTFSGSTIVSEDLNIGSQSSSKTMTVILSTGSSLSVDSLVIGSHAELQNEGTLMITETFHNSGSYSGSGNLTLIQDDLNRFTPLDISTYDGSDQIVHPDVVKFDSPWNNFTYWMSYTPFPYGDADYENPCIAVSNNGIDWTTPPGLTNPVEPQPGTGNYGDTDLFYNAATDELWLYFCGDPGGVQNDFVKKSHDGVTWEDKVILTYDGGLGCGVPAHILIGDTYYRFGVVSITAVYTFVRLDSVDGLDWYNRTVMTIDTAIPDGKYPWHVDVLYDGSNEEWIALLCVSNGSTYNGKSLMFLSSTDGSNWHSTGDYLIDHSTLYSAWDGDSTYRSSGVRENDTLRIWYTGLSSADSSHSNRWRIGYAETSLYYDGFGRLCAYPVSRGSWSIQVTGSTSFYIAATNNQMAVIVSTFNGNIALNVTKWALDSTDDVIAQWTMSCSDTDETVSFTISGLQPDTSYDLYVDGHLVQTTNSDENGNITLEWSDWSAHDFELATGYLNSVFSMFSVIFIVMIFMAICSVFVIGFRKK